MFVYLSASRMRSATALVHLRDDGTPDGAFGDRGVLDVGSFIAGESGGIDVQPSGRVLAMGSDVRAFSADGQEVPGFRTSVGYRGRHAIDDSGRLYLATTTGVIRLRILLHCGSMEAPVQIQCLGYSRVCCSYRLNL